MKRRVPKQLKSEQKEKKEATQSLKSSTTNPNRPYNPSSSSGPIPFYSKKTMDAFEIHQRIPIVYRTREDSKKEQRRYYIGYVQFAWACKVDEGWDVILTNGSQEAGLKGVIIQGGEKALHKYLEKELLEE